jgi:hypothetical protein
MLKVGDLVIWTEIGDKLFAGYYSDNYKAPGIVRKVIDKTNKTTGACGVNNHTHIISYDIYWADGRTTIEHKCYIKGVEE